MIVANIMGGLGNQMFQYATARSLSVQKKAHLSLYTKDSDVGDGCTQRELELYNFNILAKKPSLFTRIKYKKYFEMTLIKRIKRKFGITSNQIVYNDENYNKNNVATRTNKNIYLNGYFQSPKYFNDIRELLLQDFTLANEEEIKKCIMLEFIHNSNAVSVHIRRGDYVNNAEVNASFGTCSIEYYKNSIEYMKKNLTSPVFYFFSDDIEWVKENIIVDCEKHYVSDKKLKSYEELILMSKCKHNIIATSSFSWWGAWLNNNRKKITVAPKKWFINENLVNKDMIPSEWIRM